MLFCEINGLVQLKIIPRSRQDAYAAAHLLAVFVLPLSSVVPQLIDAAALLLATFAAALLLVAFVRSLSTEHVIESATLFLVALVPL